MKVTRTVDGAEQTKNGKLRSKDDVGHLFWFLLSWKKVMNATNSKDGHSKSTNYQVIRKYDHGCPMKITASVIEDFVHGDLNRYRRNGHNGDDQLEDKLNKL